MSSRVICSGSLKRSMNISRASSLKLLMNKLRLAAILSGSSNNFWKVYSLVLWKFCPAAMFSIVSRIVWSMLSGKDACLASTSSLVVSSTQSRRRRTVKGRITRPYSDCLKLPRKMSAIDQMKLTLVLKFSKLLSLIVLL